MIEFGKTLREAREAKGLTISQIAEQTHLLSQIVEDMENEDFHRISAPIYGRGFVKLYCEAVGLEAKPLVDEFMAILNGDRPAAIKMRQVELPPEEKVVEPPPPPAPPVYTQPELGDEPPAEVMRGENHLGDAYPPRNKVSRAERSEGIAEGRESLRVANEIPPPQQPRQFHPDYALPSHGLALPPNLGRLAVLAVGAIAILALLIWGGRALYRVSMGVSAEPETTQEASTPGNNGEDERQETRDASRDKKTQDKKAPEKKPEAKKPAEPAAKAPAPAKPAATRTPKDVPPLYID